MLLLHVYEYISSGDKSHKNGIERVQAGAELRQAQQELELFWGWTELCFLHQ